MATYYVTQAGAGANNGTSLANAWSLATFIGISSLTGGDIVYVSGAITGALKTSSSGTSGAQLTIDISGANIAAPNTDYQVQIHDYTTLQGGGTFSGGSNNLKNHTTAGTITIPAVCGVYPYAYMIDAAEPSTGVIIDGITVIANGTDQLGYMIKARGANNIVVQNCYMVDAQGLFFTDAYPPNGVTIRNNWVVTGTNVTGETDIIHIGDASNVTIEGNYFVMKAPGGAANSRHNDAIQVYRSNAGGNQAPYGWIIRYNWVELNGLYGATLTAGSFVVNNVYTIVTTGSTSFTAIGAANNSPGTVFTATGVGTGTGTAKDTADGNQSWGQMEQLSDNGGTVALKVYANVFKGNANQPGQGMPVYNGTNTTVYWYNNTAVSVGGSPDNTMRYLSGTGYSTLYMRNNIGFDATGTASTTIFSSFTAGIAWAYNFFFNWGSPSSTYYGTGTGATNTDPLLTNPGSQDFSLQSGSPCKWTGDSTIGSEFNQGLAAGATWPNPSKITRAGGAWSIGAFEFGGGGGGSTTGIKRISRYLRLWGPAA